MSRLAFLFKAFISETCTDEERQEFLHLAQVDDNADELNALIDQELNNIENQGTSSYHFPNELFEGILTRTRAEGRNTWRKEFRKIWFAAAAILLLILLIGSVYQIVNHTGTRIARNRRPGSLPTDIQPGGNKAILILSDNSTIILDTAKIGLVASEGNADIRKLDAGQIAYNSSVTKQKEVLYNTIVTPRGGQYKLRLPDSSEVWLNAASSIRFPTRFCAENRIVEITGEVFFEVAHNAKKPFIVRTSHAEIAVLGTSFNVNTYNEQMGCTTTLVEGSLKLFYESIRQSQVLRPGEQAFLDEGRKIILNDKVNIAAIIAWKNGYFLFSSSSLHDVMDQIARWYDIDVIYEGKIGQRNFGGKIQRDLNLLGVLQILEKNNIHFRLEGRKLYVKS